MELVCTTRARILFVDVGLAHHFDKVYPINAALLGLIMSLAACLLLSVVLN